MFVNDPALISTRIGLNDAVALFQDAFVVTSEIGRLERRCVVVLIETWAPTVVRAHAWPAQLARVDSDRARFADGADCQAANPSLIPKRVAFVERRCSTRWNARCLCSSIEWTRNRGCCRHPTLCVYIHSASCRQEALSWTS